jgi:hypothetical protein
MPLPRLPNTSFAHHCPHCGAARVNSGLWFYAIGRYKCEGCGNAVRVTYEDKIKLLNGSGVQPGAGYSAPTAGRKWWSRRPRRAG